MAENDIKKELEKLYKGVSLDIHNAETCLYLLDTIDKHASEINEKNFGNLFGNLQNILIDTALLKICRIFEREKKGYPLKSIPSILNFMKKHRDALVVQNISHIVEILERLELDSTILSRMDHKIPGFTEECVYLLLSKLSNKSVKMTRLTKPRSLVYF